MENASKALIIAGAILISILLIGLGVYIYNSAQSTVSQATLNSEVALAQNQKFETYLGNNITSSQVKQLLSLINTNNITSATSEEFKTIGVLFSYGKGTEYGGYHKNYYNNESSTFTTNVSAIVPLLKAGSTYKVYVNGVKAYNSDKFGNDGFTGEPKVATDNAAYYTSGFIRLITIEEKISEKEESYPQQ